MEDLNRRGAEAPKQEELVILSEAAVMVDPVVQPGNCHFVSYGTMENSDCGSPQNGLIFFPAQTYK